MHLFQQLLVEAELRFYLESRVNETHRGSVECELFKYLTSCQVPIFFLERCKITPIQALLIYVCPQIRVINQTRGDAFGKGDQLIR